MIDRSKDNSGVVGRQEVLSRATGVVVANYIWGQIRKLKMTKKLLFLIRKSISSSELRNSKIKFVSEPLYNNFKEYFRSENWIFKIIA